MSDKQPRRTPVRSFVKRRAQGLTRRLDPTLASDEHGNPARASGVSASPLTHMFVTIGTALRMVASGGRKTPWLSAEQQRERFERIAPRWGVSAKSEPRVRRNLRIEQIVFAAIGTYAGWLVLSGLLQAAGGVAAFSRVLLGAMLVVFAVTKIAIAGWRYDVIRDRRWRPFMQWFRGS